MGGKFSKTNIPVASHIACGMVANPSTIHCTSRSPNPNLIGQSSLTNPTSLSLLKCSMIGASLETPARWTSRPSNSLMITLGDVSYYVGGKKGKFLVFDILDRTWLIRFRWNYPASYNVGRVIFSVILLNLARAPSIAEMGGFLENGWPRGQGPCEKEQAHL